jgi:phosphotransferase system IIA component
MKSADFNRSQSKIRVLQEVRPEKKKINWDRLIYLALLVLAAISIVFMVVKKNLYVRGEGQVLFKKLDIQFTKDIQIFNLVRSEGDSVEIGDTLFLYYEEQISDSRRLPEFKEVVMKSDNLDWIVRERLTTLKRIELAQIQINDNNRLIDITEDEKKRIEHEIYLDIYPSTKLDQYVHRLMDFESGIVSAQEEIKYLKQYLDYLNAQEKIERYNLRKRSEFNASSASSVPSLHAYMSPVKGTITQVYKENFEVAMESETIMSIHKPTNLYIKAYYDQKSIRHLKEGDIVDIEFPDGSSSFGILTRFYFATYQLPDEFQKKFEPTTRSIAADIIPIDEIELDKWKSFYKLNVKISKPLFNI